MRNPTEAEALAEKARQEEEEKEVPDDDRTVTDIDDTELQKILEVLSQKYKIPQDKEIFEETTDLDFDASILI